jgi:excinuclease ABC subunit A
MLKKSASRAIRLRGVRHNNLKNFDLDLPVNQLVVITGLSGSGKSSLAFDTLFAEGQRRYIETFSPYARQFFDRMDKPRVDSIEGIPPAIAIEQRNAVRTTRSTVGTMTEICDYMKMAWPHIAQLHCRQCGQPVRKDSPQTIWQSLTKGNAAAGECLVTFDLPLTEKLSLEESLGLVAKQGYQRLLLDGEMARLEEATGRLGAGAARLSKLPKFLTVIQDRLRTGPASRARFIEACEQAYHFGKGKLSIRVIGPDGRAQPPRPFSNRLHCAACDIEYRDPSPALFSFNHPVGACPTCRGFGRVISIDYDLAMPDRSKTLGECVVKPWLTGMSAECQTDLLRACRKWNIPTDVPFAKLAKKWQDFVIQGEPGYGKDAAHGWPNAWYGVKGYFRWLESKAYKMHVRVLLSRYRAYTPCPDCQGRRFQPEALLYKAGPAEAKLTLSDFYQLPIREAVRLVDSLASIPHSALRTPHSNAPLELVFNEVRARLGYLDEVGLGYLTLDRPTRSLSGGETERVNLTTCLGTRLVNTLFVLDEPSVGLHPRDTDRLVRILKRLRDAGNTVVVVEHEASIIRAADQIIDLGPGHGATGGQVVFQGNGHEILKSPTSLTGQYLAGTRRIEVPVRRGVVGRGRVDENGLEIWGGETPSGVRPGGRMPAATTPRSAAGMPVTTYPTGGSSFALNEAPVPYVVPPLGGAGVWLPERGTTNWLAPGLTLTGATRHNLQNLSVEIPLGRLVCVTGVSGSGKSTLVREVLWPALAARLNSAAEDAKASDRMDLQEDEKDSKDESDGAPEGGGPEASVEGWRALGGAVFVDQSILGKTPRSNPAVYIGAFEDIREFFAQSDLARQRGLNSSAFSFNSTQGQCERCRGAGFEKIEMQFLSDVFVRCPDCDGRRYRAHILEVKVAAPVAAGILPAVECGILPPGPAPEARKRTPRAAALPPGRMPGSTAGKMPAATVAWSIADLLEATVEEAMAFLSAFSTSRPAQRAAAALRLLQEVGLGYLKVGQPINTLSGGESQRLKLVKHLAGVAERVQVHGNESDSVPAAAKPILFLFDEPTTGLHFDDVRILLQVLQRLVEAGHSVLVIEHNLDVIKCSDWVIDLGPEAGDQGGRIVATGTPEDIVACASSHTGKALRAVLEPQPRARHV